MKKSDLKKIIGVVALSAIISFFVSGLIFSDPEAEPMNVQVIESITSDFPRPSETHFNDDSINPTQLIRVGEDLGNESPFGVREDNQ